MSADAAVARDGSRRPPADPMQALRRLALAATRPAGPDIYQDLVAEVARALDATLAMVAVFADEQRTTMRTLAVVLNDQPLAGSVEYLLAQSPCVEVVGKGYCFMPAGVMARYALDAMVTDLRLDAYAAFPMNDSRGRPLGLVAVLDAEPIAGGDADHAEAVLKIAALRLGAELERGAADAALRRSEASYRAIFDLAEDAIFVHDWNTFRFVDVNARAVENFGYTRDELLTVDPSELMSGEPPYDMAHAAAHLEKAKQGRCPPFEWRTRLKDGRVQWQEVRLKAAVLEGRPQILAFTRDITERKASEERLRASEQQYRAIFNASEDALVLWNDQLQRVDVNPAHERLYGFARDELLGRAYEQMPYPPEHAQARLTVVRRALEGETCRTEVPALRKDGRFILTELRAIPFHHDGAPHVLTIARDITERKAAEARLREQEERYRAIFDGSSDPIVLWNRRLEVVDINAGYLRTTGFARSDIVGRHWTARPDADDMRRLVPRIEDALAGRESRIVERVTRADGSLFDIELRYLPMSFAGEPHALGIGRDISQALQAERALRDSEEQHRTIFNASVDGMLVKDADNTVVDVNEAYLRMHGFARDELLGRCLLDLLPPALRAQCGRLLPQVMAGTPCHFEAQTSRSDGSLLDVEIHGVPVAYGGQTRALVVMRDITERKRAEIRLRASEAQYRSIFNASADALVLRGADFGIVDVNATYEQMSGFRREEVLGVDRVLANPPEAGETIRALHQRALAGEPIALRTQLVRRDGHRYDLELRGVPVEHAGRPHVLYIGRDISQATQAEQALRDSEARYRAIFNTSADAIVLWDAEFRLVDANRAFTQMYGFDREEVIGTVLDGRLPPEAVAERSACMSDALAGAERMLETTTLRKNGERFDVELRYLPITHRGRPHVLAIARDITERKRAETRLRASEEQYRAIFNASADALMLWDGALRRVDVNPAHQKIFGYAREEVVGRAFEGLGWPAPMVQERLDRVRRALAGEASRVELPALRKDGRRIVTELRTIPFQHRGEPHVLQIARDVSAQRAAETERETLEVQLRQAQKMEAIGQLTGGIAHDFNNILTSVIGYLVLAQERADRIADATLVRQLGSAQTAAQRARELIAQMLAFARRQRGDRRLLALTPLVRQALQLLRSTMPSSIVIDDAGLGDDAALPPVRADAVQIEQVLFNLCINARDAMPRGGRITVKLQQQHEGGAGCASCGSTALAGRWLRLTVADTGSGIDPAVVPRMFEPFFTTKEVGGGSGMGLAMVHGIVHEHEGHVVVETVPGHGSSFHVLLPAADGAVEPSAPSAPSAAPGAPLAGRVMLVEDEPAVSAFMRELLEGWGLEVITPPDALAAARWFDDPAHEVDLLITDQTMPQMGGLELAHHVGVLRPRMPVLLYSGDTDALDPDALRRAGVRDVLAKPVDARHLASLLRHWLGPR